MAPRFRRSGGNEERDPGQEEARPKYRSFSEVYEEARQLRGDKVSPGEIIGMDFVVLRYLTLSSRFGEGEYVAVQIEIDGEPFYFNSASVPLRDALDRTAHALPYRATLVERESRGGRSYLAFE